MKIQNFLLPVVCFLFPIQLALAGDKAAPAPGAPDLPLNHLSMTAPLVAPGFELTGIQPADGGKTVKEIFATSTALAGKTVTVRGKVVKSNVHILGKNWLHIQDGTGTPADRNNDLTVTTTANAAVGDTVLITGTVSTNQDFGAGYRFGVIIVDAKVKVE